MTPDTSPLAILGLDAQASTEEVRARYATLVKRHPPDRDPEAFQRIRDAWLTVRDPRALAEERILGPEPLGSLDVLVDALAPERRPTEAEAWIEALRELSR